MKKCTAIYERRRLTMNGFDDFPNRYRNVQRSKSIVKDAYYLLDNRNEYLESLNLLNMNENYTCGMLDSNLCVASSIDNNWRLISDKSFIAGISKQKINKAYSCLKNYFRVYSRYYPFALKYVAEYHKYINEMPKENALDFLYNLTLGNNDVLNDFASLCFFITKIPFSLNQPMIIYAKKSLHQSLIDFIERLSERNNINYSLKSLLKTANLIELYTYGLNSNGINVVELGEMPTTEASIYKIKQVLSGEKLGIKNPDFAGKTYIKNRVPFVFITDSHRRYIKFKQMFGAFDVRFDPNASFDFDDKTIDWFRRVFTELGQKWLYSKNHRVLRSIDTKDEIVRAFMRDICKIKDGEFCKKASLYSAYCEYYKYYYAGEPLKMTSFGRALNFEKKFREYRKHISREEYPCFYEGITISKIKYERFKKLEGIKYHCSYDSFKKYIFEWIDKEVKIPESSDEPRIDQNKRLCLENHLKMIEEYRRIHADNPET